jgi:hypothetical protein
LAKVWVLDTETKGTGAEMVPLEKVLSEPRPPRPVRRTPPKSRPRPGAAAPKAARRFRVVDVMTGRTLADDVATREALEALRGLRSVVDVSVYLHEDGRWRPLTLGERKALWALREA